MTAIDLTGRATQLRADRVPYVHATVVRAVAPTSARAGDTALVHADGRLEGFVGGTCAESSVRLYSLRALESGVPLLLRILPEELPDPSGAQIPADGTVTVGNPCLSGGEIEVFLEPRLPAPRLLVEGHTPISRALVELGGPLGYLVETYDVDTPGMVAPPAADDAGVVVASHGRGETPVLEAALKAGVRYVALVASRRRGAEVLSSLDVSDDQKARVRTPAGLWIGARTPAEIALSIFAEMIAVRANVHVGGANPDDSTARSADGGPSAHDDEVPGDDHSAVAATDDSAGLIASPPPDPPAAAGSSVASAIDPMCGMTVAAVPATLHVANPDGTTTYFCREGCRAAYLASA